MIYNDITALQFEMEEMLDAQYLLRAQLTKANGSVSKARWSGAIATNCTKVK